VRKILGTVLAAAVAVVLGACNADMRGNPINTDITFTIEAFHQVTLDSVVPMVDVMVSIPGYQPWLIAHNVPAPYRFTVYSSEYSQAANQTVINAKLVEPNADVVLKCTWSAQTPSGVRLSRDSAGGEGESYAGAPVRCQYTA